MSVYFGIVNFDGQPAQKRLLETICKAVRHLGPDGQTLLVRDCVAFGHAKRMLEVENALESLPVEFPDLVITGKFRLDNRPELLDRLEIPKYPGSTILNSTLVVEAYRKWGEGCTEKLLGDFSFAIWNKKKQELFIGRDQFGNTELYFFQGTNYILFCSSLAGLLAHPGVPKAPNPRAVALSMVRIFRADGSMTFYDRVRQVPSSHNLVVRNNQARLSQYWSLEQIRDIRYRNEEEYVEEFCNRFTAAVTCRLRTSKGVGIKLSGGLDSGSVAILAAKELKEQGQTLHAFTSVPLHDVTGLVDATVCADESASARLIALAAGNIHLTTVNAQGKTPLQGITEAMEILKHPAIAIYNCFWLLSIYELMQAQGLGTVLSGQFGNATISWNGNLFKLLRNLLWRGNVSQVHREFTLLRKRKGWSYPTSIKNLIIAPLVPRPLLERKRYLAAGPRPWENYSALNPDFARRQNLRDLMWQCGVFANSPTNPAIRESLLPVGMSSGTGVGASLAAPFGLESLDPTADKRLIEFCFGIPESQYIYNDKKRLLIRKAMKGKLPEPVLTNEKYGSQSADLVLRIRDNQAEMAEELDNAARSPLTREYLDVPRMRDAFEAALTRLDQNATMEAGGILLKGLITSKFLRSFEA